MTSPTPKINPLPVIQQAVKMGLSAREGLVAAREVGVKIRDSTWFQLYGQVKAQQTFAIGESAELLTARPHASQIGTTGSKVATGYMQYATVYVRDTATGIVSTRPFAVRTMALHTRGEVIEKALNAFTSAATPSGNYGGETVLGAAYGATTQFVPIDLSEDEL